jgi:hypothetical protein
MGDIIAYHAGASARVRGQPRAVPVWFVGSAEWLRGWDEARGKRCDECGRLAPFLVTLPSGKARECEGCYEARIATEY